MNKTKLYLEAKRLHQMGFAIIWLHPNSKRPVETGWTTGPRKSWKELRATYSKGLNVGVRLGMPSHIEGRGYLAVIDMDVKSTDERHQKEAVHAALQLLHGAKCPIVLSGRGNGSRHYYCVTEKPFKTFNPAVSDEQVKVYMPSKTKLSKKELEQLTEKEIKQGIRIANAWEISLYSNGRQVVLPPSIHPDSNKPYFWKRGFESIESLPVVEFDLPNDEPAMVAGDDSSEPISKTASPATASHHLEGFEVTPVDLEWVELSDKIKNGIMSGDGVTDRSAFLLKAASALISAGLTQNEVLTVLTDPKTYLGACGYEHAKTKSRVRAANWIYKYTLKKVIDERSAQKVFENVAIVEPSVTSEEEQEKQNAEIESERDWTEKLDKTDKGKYRPTFHNCKMILSHATSEPGIIGRNEFAGNDFYLIDSPWRSRKDEAVVDHDLLRFKGYCVEKFGIEFPKQTLDEAFQYVADQHRFHPVKDWLAGLEWDGVRRIDSWLKDYAGAEAPEPYLSDVSRKFLVAMIARIYEPGKKFDTILILEGDQGTGKSTLLSNLVGDQWFTDQPIVVGEKDSILTIQSKWLVELGELSTMSKSDLELFKAFVAQRTDRIRVPYGRRTEEFPRQSVFAGTTNLEEYLRDMTGNRRFWTVKLTAAKIDFEGIKAVREQLFAEALAMYQMGEPLWLENEESESQAKREQASRLQVDEWQPLVREIVDGEMFPREKFTLNDVAKRMEQVGAHRLTPLDGQRIARCLKMVGCNSWRETTGPRQRYWKKEDVQRGHSPSTSPVDVNLSMIEDF